MARDRSPSQHPTVPAGAMLAFVLCLGASVPAAPTLPSGSATALALSAQPISGDAPLLVELSATLTPTTIGATFNWSFGDGGSLRVNSTGASTIGHQYARPGSYLVEVTASSASFLLESNLVVSVDPGPVAAQIRVSTLAGPAPLTVSFTALITGGSGTYPSVLWSFGDGQDGTGLAVNFTYVHAGTYVANLTVTDTMGHQSNASATIRANPTSSPATASSFFGPEAVLLGVALAAASSAAVAYWVAVLRRPSAAGTREVPDGAVREPPTAGPPTTAVRVHPGAGAVPSGENRAAYEQILTHLYGMVDRVPGTGGSAATAQEGMARELGVAPSTIGRALRRLSAAGMIRPSLEHVPGSPRRLTCYALTPRGRALARALQAPPSAGPESDQHRSAVRTHESPSGDSIGIPRGSDH